MGFFNRCFERVCYKEVREAWKAVERKWRAWGCDGVEEKGYAIAICFQCEP